MTSSGGEHQREHKVESSRRQAQDQNDRTDGDDRRRRRRRRPVSDRSGTSLLGRIAAHLDFPSRDLLARDAEALAAQFDTSPFRLWLLFRSVDTNHDGYITKNELIKALSSTAQSAAASPSLSCVGPSSRASAAGVPKEEIKMNDDDSDGEDEDDDDSDESDPVLPLEDIQALDELFDLVVTAEQYDNNNDKEKEHEYDEEKEKRGTNLRQDRNQSTNDDERTIGHRNFPSPDISVPFSSQSAQSCAPGITFPQFCRIMRYLWLQQLLQPDINNDNSIIDGAQSQGIQKEESRLVREQGTHIATSSDIDSMIQPTNNHNHNNNNNNNKGNKTGDNGYAFECVDYASGYYRHRRIAGNVKHKRTRNFYLAPRHGNARMRWIDVPSGTYVPNQNINNNNNNTDQYQQRPLWKSQRESFRITILRLAVKYRFHPTSIEDAMDLDLQEPKVNSFEHSLLDLGKFKCGTISWLQHAGEHHHDRSSTTCTADPQSSAITTKGSKRNETTPKGSGDNTVPSLPQPGHPARDSSNLTFHSYQRESITSGEIPDFVVAEGEDDVNINEGRHYFVTIPMFELSRRSQTSLDLYNEASGLLPFMDVQPLVIEVNEATLGIFVASLPDSNLVVTCSTKWRPTRIRPSGFRDNHRANAKQRKAIVKSLSQKNMPKRPDVASSEDPFHDWGGNDGSSNSSESAGPVNATKDIGDEMIESNFQHEKMPLERVKELLKKRHSIQRHRSSSWLMHAIIDAVVDNLGSISKIYEAQLQRMATRLFELQHRLSRQEVKEMIVMRRDLEWLQHELRPFARVIRHLIDDRNIGVEVTHYLEDVEDHLLRTIDELTSFATECVSLKDEYNAYLDRRMNDILYILTLVTTLVVPAQFFTGYFGMNFENDDGSLGDPLLNKGTTGTGIFWVIVIGCTLLLVYTMHRYHFFEKEIEL